jgi:tRNA-dihydrouridine synthase 3
MDGVIDDEAYPSLDFSTTCPEFAATGECKFGIRCRFLGSHVEKGLQSELLVKVDEEKKARTVASEHELNFVGAETLKLLRTNKVDLIRP